jgi:hypothetical protein
LFGRLVQPAISTTPISLTATFLARRDGLRACGPADVCVAISGNSSADAAGPHQESTSSADCFFSAFTATFIAGLLREFFSLTIKLSKVPWQR